MEQLISTPPKITLKVFDFGAIMEKVDEDGTCSSYAVDPRQIAAAMASNIAFETGILAPACLYIWTAGIRKIIVEYREPQLTALFLEGSEEPYRVPLPGLILIRNQQAERVKYSVFSVLERPTTGSQKLFAAPLPNLGRDGVCWGTVPKPSAEALRSNSLEEDWRLLLGSRFNSHSVDGKSLKFKQDIRKMYADLEKRKAKVYPVKDLVKYVATFEQVLKEMRRDD